MLYRFEFANVYSFADPQVLDLRIGAAVPDEPGRFALVWPGSAERAPKVVALFGANASGKSNVLRAAAFLTDFVANSFRFSPELPLPVRWFQGEPPHGSLRMAAEFGGPAKPNGPPGEFCGYRYEVELADRQTEPAKATLSPTVVRHEALFYHPPGAARRRRLFIRDPGGQVTAAPEFGLSRLHVALQRILRPDASVISTLAQLNHAFAAQLVQAARKTGGNIQLEQMEPNDDAVVRYLADNPSSLKRLNQDLEQVDLGILEMHIVQGPSGPTQAFRHAGLSGSLLSTFESHGTRRFVRLHPLIAQTLKTGGIALIDELDQALHPVVLAEVVRWFHDPERNPHNAQLWMTCQSPALLDELRKEEVFLCEKDPQGRSRVYGLRDIQGVRRDENLARNYLGGVYGAVPHLG